MLPRVGKEFMLWIRIKMCLFCHVQTMLLTNTLSGGIMLGLGDIVQQSWEKVRKPERVRDWRRTGCMFMVGCCFGLLLHYWYIWLDGVFIGDTLEMVGKKFLVDQLVASPFLGMWYFLGTGLMEGHTLSEGWKRIKHKFCEFYKVDCCVWLPAQMINFYFCSPKFKTMYLNFVTLGWISHLSYLKHRV